MQTMYEGKVNSPETILDGGINDVITTINVINGSVLPVAPNIAVIGTEIDAETISYANRAGNVLSNVTRGFQGVAKAWSSGEAIARLFTEYDYGTLKGNVETIAGRKITDFGECSSEELRGKITDETGTGKAVFGTYPDITKINLTEGQIKFPAAVNPSADPNTQDDYEEGEWTPALKFGGNSVGMIYLTQNGLYTKMGRKVTVTGYFLISAKGTSTGSAKIYGVPFVSKGHEGARSAVSLRFWSILYANNFMGDMTKNSNLIELFECTEAGLQSRIRDYDFTNDSAIIFSLTYFTD